MRKLQIKTLADRFGGAIETLTPVDNPLDEQTSGSSPCNTSCVTSCWFGQATACTYYYCPSGTTVVCRPGYCSTTSYSCLP